MYAIDVPVPGPEQPIYVVLCVQYEKLDNFRNALPSDFELLCIKVLIDYILS